MRIDALGRVRVFPNLHLRSVADMTRMLPYHVAWGRGHRMAAGLLNPTVNIDAALETAREHDQGAPQPCLCSGSRSSRPFTKHDAALKTAREHYQVALRPSGPLVCVLNSGF